MLSRKQEKIASIAAYTAISDVKNLTLQLSAGLDAGLTINEIKEIFIQLCMYCGFPRGIRGVDVFTGVLEERKLNGVGDQQGSESSPVNNTLSKYEHGEAVHVNVTGLTKEQLRFGAMAFIPKIDVQLKEYIFADVYDSDILSYSDREIATVSALLAMNDIEPQIQFHLNTALNVGLSVEEANQIISIAEIQFGAEKGHVGRALLANVIASRQTKK